MLKTLKKVNIIGTPISNAERYKGEDEFGAKRSILSTEIRDGVYSIPESLDYKIEAPDGSSIMPADNNSGKKSMLALVKG